MLKESKYEKMRRDLLARILSGQFPDKRLPALKQLADDYGVSLMTANRAVKMLEAAGIVQCCPGNVGTVINEAAAARRSLESSSPRVWLDTNLFCGAGVRLKYFCSDLNAKNQDLWAATLEGFKKQYPWIEVDIQPGGSIENDLDSLSGFDVLQLFGRDVGAFQRQGALSELTSLVARTPELGAEHVAPNLLKHCEVDGGIHALPFQANVPVIFYNKELFGGVPDNLERSWETFREHVRKASAEALGVGMALGMASLARCFLGDLRLLDGDDFDRGALAEMLKLLKYLALLEPDGRNLEPGFVFKGFVRREIKFFCAYSSYIRAVSDECDFAWGLLPMPLAKSAVPVLETSVNAVGAGSRHKKEAWLFAKHLCSAEAQTQLCQARNFIPVNHAVLDGYEPGLLKSLLTRAEPSSIASRELFMIYSRVTPALGAYYRGERSADDTIDDFALKTREILALETIN